MGFHYILNPLVFGGLLFTLFYVYISIAAKLKVPPNIGFYSACSNKYIAI